MPYLSDFIEPALSDHLIPSERFDIAPLEDTGASRFPGIAQRPIADLLADDRHYPL
jgi:hypothetical protein